MLLPAAIVTPGVSLVSADVHLQLLEALPLTPPASGQGPPVSRVEPRTTDMPLLITAVRGCTHTQPAGLR